MGKSLFRDYTRFFKIVFNKTHKPWLKSVGLSPAVAIVNVIQHFGLTISVIYRLRLTIARSFPSQRLWYPFSLAVFVGQASNSQLLPLRQLPPQWLVFVLIIW